MASPSKPSAAEADQALSLELTRVFDAPPGEVFRSWIEPERIARWIGPRSIKAEVVRMDARPGGSYRIRMHDESGKVYTVSGVYREIIFPERLVFTWAWEEDGHGHRSGHESVAEITCRAIGRKTEMTIRHGRFETKESRDSHDHGWSGSFDKLADVLAGKPGRI
ncbi:MAG TPA: SRPBCC domain-containing protein [Alphaproteobacteria bacterium]|nr:SRPBCC domain-containing protein [Alphaproteobacteria bacterium]